MSACDPLRTSREVPDSEQFRTCLRTWAPLAGSVHTKTHGEIRHEFFTRDIPGRAFRHSVGAALFRFSHPARSGLGIRSGLNGIVRRQVSRRRKYLGLL